MFRVHVTHDIDHVGIKDHYCDLSMPKFVVLNLIGLAKRELSIREFTVILAEIVRSMIFSSYDSWDCIDEWRALEESTGVESTWFVACRPGRGLSYRPQRVIAAVRFLQEWGRVVGLHAQCRDDVGDLPNELAQFRDAYQIESVVPVRFHYLVKNESEILAYRDSFAYDSSVFDERRFFCSDEFERPINIMDTYFFCPLRKTLTLEEAQAQTLLILDEARALGREVVVDFHQRSLSRCFPRYAEYIRWFYSQISAGHDAFKV